MIQWHPRWCPCTRLRRDHDYTMFRCAKLQREKKVPQKNFIFSDVEGAQKRRFYAPDYTMFRCAKLQREKKVPQKNFIFCMLKVRKNDDFMHPITPCSGAQNCSARKKSPKKISFFRIFRDFSKSITLSKTVHLYTGALFDPPLPLSPKSVFWKIVVVPPPKTCLFSGGLESGAAVLRTSTWCIR